MLSPKESIIWKLYKSFAHPFAKVISGVSMSWDTSTVATTCPSSIELAVWSPCNKFIAMTQCGTKAIGILESVTLQQLQILQPPRGTSTHLGVLIFSPNSQMLTYSGPSCLDHEVFVISWDLQTGGIVSINKWQVSVQDIVVAPSITYSTDGKMVGVFCQPLDGAVSIFICTVASGIYTHSHSLDVGAQLSGNIWAYGGSLRFTTADRTTITIWEVGFTPGAAPAVVKTLPAPDNLADCKRIGIQLLPSLCRLAIAYRDKVLVWDVWNSRCMLHYTGTGFDSRMSFSPSGHFFACKTSGSEIYLWRESSNGYILHKVLLSSAVYSTPIFSQNGESIAMFGGCTIQLWQTRKYVSPLPSTLTKTFQDTGYGELPSSDMLVKQGVMPWFTQGRHSVWCAKDQDLVNMQRVSEPEVLGLEVPLAGFEHQSTGHPQGPSHSYQIKDDWWVCGPDGRRLLMLPSPWASDLVKYVWKGQYLVLLYHGVSEPVVLDLKP